MKFKYMNKQGYKVLLETSDDITFYNQVVDCYITLNKTTRETLISKDMYFTQGLLHAIKHSWKEIGLWQ